MKNMRQVVIDMDGTFVDLYGVENWEEQLHNSDVTPYEIAEPLVNMEEMRELLEMVHALGGIITIVSWSAMNGSKEYNKEVKKAKIEWCKNYNLPIDNFHVVKYGTKKWYPLKEREYCILFDDNAEVRASFEDEENDRVSADASDMLNILKVMIKSAKQKNEENCRKNTRQTKWGRAEEEDLFSQKFKDNFIGESGLYMLGQTTINPITKEERYWIKIGLTTNGNSRLDTYLTHCADVYFIDWLPFISKSELRKTESACHKILNKIAYARRTEWFKVSEDFYFNFCDQGFEYLDVLDN